MLCSGDTRTASETPPRRRSIRSRRSSPANRELLEAQHVHDAHLRDPDAKELRALIHHGADEQPAVRSALDRQLRRRRVLLRDQPLGSRDEVVEYVLLACLHALLMPRFSILAAAAQVGGRKYDTRSRIASRAALNVGDRTMLKPP